MSVNEIGMNMLLHGEPKTWYVTPPDKGPEVEALCRTMYPQLFRLCMGFMSHKNCLLAPHVLREHNIPFKTVVQRKNELIIVFPYSYHQVEFEFTYSLLFFSAKIIVLKVLLGINIVVRS